MFAAPNTLLLLLKSNERKKKIKDLKNTSLFCAINLTQRLKEEEEKKNVTERFDERWEDNDGYILVSKGGDESEYCGRR